MSRIQHRNLSQIMGSWPFQATGKIGPYGSLSSDFFLFPTTLKDRAIILGTVREPATKFDVGGESFYIWIDTAGSPYTPTQRQITFPSGGPYTLAEVIAEINNDDGEANPTAFDDNGFLRLESPRTGENSYLRIQTNATSGPDVLAKLGLYAETVSVGGELTQAQHVDPDRQIALPQQTSMPWGESFDANTYNRLAFQLASNTSVVNNMLTQRRLAVKKEAAITYATASPEGVTLTGYVYTGPSSYSTPPTIAQLENIFTILDEFGNELVNEEQTQVGSTSSSLTVSEDDQHKALVDINDAAFTFAVADPENEVYVVFTGLTGGNSTFNNIPLKVTGYTAADQATIQDIHPDTGIRMDLSSPVAPSTCQKVSIAAERVVVEGVYTDSTGVTSAAHLQQTKETGSVTRVELNNRIVVSGADFATNNVAEGDLVEWTGHTETDPYSNNATYRVSQVVDLETLELVTDEYEPVYLNPVEGTSFGSITVKTDGTFWKDPFIKFDTNTAPANSQDIIVLYLGMDSFSGAAQSDAAFLSGTSLKYMQEADAGVQQAILNIVGPSVENFEDVLYPTDNLTNMSLERLHFRQTKEHDVESGRHRDIAPDTIDMWHDSSGGIAGETVAVWANSGDAVDQKKISLKDDAGDELFYVEANGDVTTRTFGTSTIGAYGYSGGASTGGRLELRKSGGGSVGTLAATSNGDEYGSIYFYGTNTSPAHQVGALVRAIQVGAAGASWVPTKLIFETSDGTASPADRFSIDENGNVGVGTITPDTLFHIEGSSPISRLEDLTSGDTALTRTMSGVEVMCGGMDTSAKYTPAFKFLSYDGQFTTENPKFLAGVVGRATEAYTADTAGGMALELLATENSPGATSIPSVIATARKYSNLTATADFLKEEAAFDVGGVSLIGSEPGIGFNMTFGNGGWYYGDETDAAYVTIKGAADDLATFIIPSSLSEPVAPGSLVRRMTINDVSSTTAGLGFGFGFIVPGDDTFHIRHSASGYSPVNMKGLFVENSSSAANEYVFGTATTGGGAGYSFWVLNNGYVGLPGLMGIGDASIADISNTNGLCIREDTSSAVPKFRVMRTNTSTGAVDIGLESTGNWIYSRSQDFYIGSITSNAFNVRTGTGTQRLHITSDGKLSTNAETSPDILTGGMCLNIGSSSGKAFSLKSTANTHNMQDLPWGSGTGETDTQFAINAGAGAVVSGWSNGSGDDTGLALRGFGNTVDDTESNSGTGAVMITAGKYDGVSGVDPLGNDENILAIRNLSTARAFFKGDGDLVTDLGTINSFDDEQDAVACMDMASIMSNDLDKIITYNKERFEELGIMKNGFMSSKKMTALQLGAIGELYGIVSILCEKLGLTYEDLRKLVRGIEPQEV